MKIQVALLLASLAQDTLHMNQNAEAFSQHERVVLQAVSNTDMGDSAGYDGFRSYMTGLMLPAIRVQHDAALAFVSDLQTDQGRLVELSDAGPVIDTDRMEAIVASFNRSASYCEQVAGTLAEMPDAQRAVSDLADGLRSNARQAQQKLDAVMRYLGDGGIYAATEGCLGAVNASKRALSSARVDAVAGVWNMAGVDLSWVPAFDAAYWERRNRLLLLQFVTLDADGQITGFKPEAFPKLVELMAGLVGAIQSNEPGAFPDYMNGLSPDEQYVLIWLGTVIPDILYGIGVDRARGMTATDGNPASGGITMLQLFTELCELTGLPNPMKDLLSFTADGGQFHNNNVRGSIQQKAGYSDFIELWGPALGMDLDTTVTTFMHDGREYRLQSWGGTYGFGTTYGGEIGLYSREAPKSGEDAYKSMSVKDMKANVKTLTTTQVNSICRTYDTVEGRDQPEIVMRVVSKGGNGRAVLNAGRTYWAYTVKPLQNDHVALRDRAIVQGYLRFSDRESLAQAAHDALREQGIEVENDATDDALTVVWK